MRSKGERETVESVEVQKRAQKAQWGEHLTMSDEAPDMENEKSQGNRHEDAASEAETLQRLKG